jgi:hypothetical protein
VSEDDLDRLIAQWAARHAPELIARAQAEALDAARARLQGRLVEALLDATNARMRAAERPEPKHRSAAPGAVPLLWVYGVVAGDVTEPPDAGVDGHAVRLHRHAGMTALVSQVPQEDFGEEALTAQLEDLDRLEALARSHEAVLESAMAGGAVIPFRICTIYSSPDGLDAMLDREALTLTAALDRLDGMQEWGVKAFARAPATVVEGAATPASGTEYLSRKQERREAADAGREATEAIVAECHSRLTEAAAAAALSRPQDRRLSGRDEEMILNAAYLVPAERADAFGGLVDELGRRHAPDGVGLELTGPWPPYHFVETPAP